MITQITLQAEVVDIDRDKQEVTISIPTIPLDWEPIRQFFDEMKKTADWGNIECETLAHAIHEVQDTRLLKSLIVRHR